MSIDEYTFPFKHARPSLNATICPVNVSVFEEEAEKAEGLKNIRVNAGNSAIQIGRFTARFYARKIGYAASHRKVRKSSARADHSIAVLGFSPGAYLVFFVPEASILFVVFALL